MDERALAFNVDPSGAPGTHWPERRLGIMRPKLEWKIEERK
jgi:lipopolysaccharide transport system ATP-binding protein